MIGAAGLRARVGSFALHDVSFTIPRGSYGVVIGPAGAGKTTLLETIAGITPLTGGTLHLGERDASHLPPERRGIGFVYQHSYLFPHLSVSENVAYAATDPALARDIASRLGVDALEDRPVRSLSGGERQLVALARALAPRPAVLLLDEPFGALDPRRRAHARREVRAIHREWGLTVLQVTHDFAEAGYLGDVLVLLDGGRVLQAGPPETVFRKPATPYVAEFLGAENVFAGTARLLELSPGAPAIASAPALGRAVVFETSGLSLDAIGDVPPGPCHAVLRGEEVVVSLEPLASSARNHFEGEVQEVAVAGPLARVTISVRGVPLVAALTSRSAQEMSLRAGVRVSVSFKAMAVHLC